MSSKDGLVIINYTIVVTFKNVKLSCRFEDFFTQFTNTNM